jgi:hypothetical protein
MQFMVFSVGEDLSFRFSDCGNDDWKLATFKRGIRDTQSDVTRSGQVLDCLGQRRQRPDGPVWHISRDDMTALEVIGVCRQICCGRHETSSWDFTAMVTRAVCQETGIEMVRPRICQIAVEVNRSYLANVMPKKGKL